MTGSIPGGISPPPPQGGGPNPAEAVGHDVVRTHVWVSGRVQGVWFRESCRRTAVHRHVTGWARNLADGRVEAVFEGQRADVDYLVAWCHDGSSRAVVTRVETRPERPEGLTKFDVG